MTGTDAYRRLRREVHDILEVGGDAHPMGRVVNGFIITLIFLNAVAFAADTVPELAERYGWEFKAFNVFSVIVFTFEYVLRVWSAVEIPMLSRPPRGQARLRFAMRPMMIIDLLAFAPSALALSDRSPAPQGIQAVSPAHARGLLASAADARPRRCR
jgi:voltage-gated potassium channel